MMIGMITRKAVVISGLALYTTAGIITSIVNEVKLEKQRKRVNALMSDDDFAKKEREIEESMQEIMSHMVAMKAKKDIDAIEQQIEDLKKKMKEMEDSENESEAA